MKRYRLLVLAAVLTAAACGTVLEADGDGVLPPGAEDASTTDAADRDAAADSSVLDGSLETTPPTLLLASGLGDVRELAIDENDVVFTSFTKGTLGRFPKVGGGPVTTLMDAGFAQPTNGLTVEFESIWATSFLGAGPDAPGALSGVARYDKDAGSVITMPYASCGRVRGLALTPGGDLGTIYYHQQCAGEQPQIRRARKVDPGASNAKSAFDVDGGYDDTKGVYGYVAIVGGKVFFSNARDIYWLSLGFQTAAGQLTLLASTVGPINALIADANMLYAHIGGQLVSVHPTTGTITPLTKVVPHDAKATGVSIKLAVDDNFLYATSPGSREIVRTSKMTFQSVPDRVVFDPKIPRSVALDTTHVYGSNAAGDVWRIQKN